MKKIFLGMAMLITISTYSQYNMRKYPLVMNYKMQSADTTFSMNISANYTWSANVIWSGVGGTPDAVFSIRVSYDGINWIDYAGSLTYTMSSATGKCAFEDDRLAFNFIQLRIQRNNATGGNTYCYMTLQENK